MNLNLEWNGPNITAIEATAGGLSDPLVVGPFHFTD